MKKGATLEVQGAILEVQDLHPYDQNPFKVGTERCIHTLNSCSRYFKF